MNIQDTSRKPPEKRILTAKATGKSKLLDEVREAITHEIEYPTTNNLKTTSDKRPKRPRHPSGMANESDGIA